jgi:nitrite reductase/ring-hydroxylating ferredoxin subunit/uncharacterized membrane protein
MSISPPTHRQLTPLEPLVARIEAAEPLDSVGKSVGKAVRQATSSSGLKDVLSGTWLGHAVHPMLTDVVIGSFTSASLLDLLAPGGDGSASEKLIALGLAAYLPTAATGANDWADSEPVDATVRRTGLVHAGTNAVASLLYVASWRARRRGGRRRGAALGFAGLGVLMVGGYLGGHLSMSKGVGPDQTVFDPGPTDWTAVPDAPDLTDGQPTRVVVDDTPVLLVRRGAEISAIHDRCSHRGCSLAEGDLDGHEITCACHGSRFDVRDGALKAGPATAAQPAFEVRQTGGGLEVRRRHGA